LFLRLNEEQANFKTPPLSLSLLMLELTSISAVLLLVEYTEHTETTYILSARNSCPGDKLVLDANTTFAFELLLILLAKERLLMRIKEN